VLAPRGAVWVADAIRALAELPAADSAVVLRALGHVEAVAGAGYPPPITPPDPEPPPRSTSDDATTPVLDLLDPDERLGRRPSRARVEESGQPVPVAIAPVAHLPVFPPGREARVLRAALARPAPGRAPDIPRAVRRLAQGRALVPIPWRQRWSVAGNSTLMLDIGAGMAPFEADQDDVVAAGHDVVGRGALRVERFRQIPTRPAGSGTGAIWTWRRYRLPPPRTAVLFVTDLGLARPLPDTSPAAPSEWLELFTALARREVVPVVLLPYPPSRVPSALRRHAAIIYWERHTSPRRARWLVRRRVHER
jgi:hypothetical protein